MFSKFNLIWLINNDHNNLVAAVKYYIPIYSGKDCYLKKQPSSLSHNIALNFNLLWVMDTW